MDCDIPDEMRRLVHDRMGLMHEMVMYGALNRRKSRGYVTRRPGVRGRRQALKASRVKDWWSVTTYGQPAAANSEGDLYQRITGHRPSWEAA